MCHKLFNECKLQKSGKHDTKFSSPSLGEKHKGSLFLNLSDTQLIVIQYK